MVIDGVAGLEKSLSFLGPFHDLIMASGDYLCPPGAAVNSCVSCQAPFYENKRFEGIEMKKKSHIDAIVSLSLIFLLMVTLIGMNTGYIIFSRLEGKTIHGLYPVSSYLAGLTETFEPRKAWVLMETSWWSHILLIFFFANYLPYSKHFHVFMSVPNVFLSRLEPLGKLYNMDNVTREVKLMMNPDTAFSASPEGGTAERFGVRDAEDVTWKNYFDALSCTECGRCTAVCPANLTGKKLSPRKIMMDLRARMKERALMIKNGKDFDDGKLSSETTLQKKNSGHVQPATRVQRSAR
jgi:ferredoxin